MAGLRVTMIFFPDFSEGVTWLIWHGMTHDTFCTRCYNVKILNKICADITIIKNHETECPITKVLEFFEMTGGLFITICGNL